MDPIIIYIDDEDINLTVFKASLPEKWIVHTFNDPCEAEKVMASLSPWVIVSDQCMPGMSGIDVLQASRVLTPDARRILVTAYSDEDTVIETIRRAKVFDYLQKPWDTNELVRMLEHAVESYRIEMENKRLKGEVDQLEIERRAAESASHQKGLFLANMSHELRTPLNAIIGYSELLLDSVEDDGGPQMHADDLSKIKSAGKHLLTVVSDILDFTKLEENMLDVSLTDVDISAVVNETVIMVEPLIKANDNRLAIDIKNGLINVSADPQRLKQILINLISNAAKFTESGLVSLRIYSRQDKVFFDIEDTGIGIKPNDSSKLFAEFTQLDMTTTKQVQGTGLGLAISKRLARLMGGDITAISEYGKGSTFTLSLVGREG